MTFECECLPGQVCETCQRRGYTNGLAGLCRAHLIPSRSRKTTLNEQDRADRNSPDLRD